MDLVEVTFKGEASSELADEFDCAAVVVDGGVTHLHVSGDTVILQGILRQVDALGLELISVRELGAATHSPTPPTHDTSPTKGNR